MSITDAIKTAGIGLLVALGFGLGFSGMHYLKMNNKVIKDGTSKMVYKADFPFGYTRLTLDKFGDYDDIFVEKFRFNRHTHTWWDLPETDYLDAYWNGRWYSHGKDNDDVLASEKKNLESELERFGINR